MGDARFVPRVIGCSTVHLSAEDCSPRQREPLRILTAVSAPVGETSGAGDRGQGTAGNWRRRSQLTGSRAWRAVSAIGAASSKTWRSSRAARAAPRGTPRRPRLLGLPPARCTRAIRTRPAEPASWRPGARRLLPVRSPPVARTRGTRTRARAAASRTDRPTAEARDLRVGHRGRHGQRGHGQSSD